MMKEDSYGVLPQLDADSQKTLIAANAENDKKKIELGWLGRIFGEGKNCSHNAAVLIVVVGIVALFVVVVIAVSRGTDNQLVWWDKVAYLVSMALGFLFGMQTVKGKR